MMLLGIRHEPDALKIDIYQKYQFGEETEHKYPVECISYFSRESNCKYMSPYFWFLS